MSAEPDPTTDGSARAASLLDARGLVVTFRPPRGLFAPSRAPTQALRGVDLAIRSGESVALVGESGSGKSTLARTLLRLHAPDAGSIAWTARDGRVHDLARCGARDLRAARRDIGIVFQDPFASLDPRQDVRSILGEALHVHGLARGPELDRHVSRLLDRVHLPRSALTRRPHAFSGGERQRIALARAIATEPRLLILDEAFSALDATRQLELCERIESLRRDLGFACLVIAHDLVLARRLAPRAVVLYAGRVVEEGPSAIVLATPAHPYTRALLASEPTLEFSGTARDAATKRAPTLAGDPPSATTPPTGCAFHPRCPLAEEACARAVPELEELALGHRSACPIVARDRV